MSKIPSPFETPKHSERTANQTYVEWINRIFSEMSNGYCAKQETILADQKSPDIVLYDGSQKPFCVIELKSPAWDILTDDLVRKTYYEASKVSAPYFATCNMNKLMLFDTEKYGRGILAKKSIYDSIVHPYEVVYLTKFEDLDITENKIRVQNFLKKFLEELSLLYTKQKTAPKTAIDEYFITHLHTTIDSIAISYKEAIQKKAESDVKFKEHIVSWFSEQMWSFYGDSENYERIARQAAYLLINKILFYHALSEKYGLEPLAIPESLRSGSRLQNELQWFFNEVLKIDYETIFTANFIDNISFPEDEKAIQSVKDLIVELNRHKMSQIGYDVIGQIFEKLIPESERHKLGQYFTSADVVDLILKFCVRNENDIIMDPSCGAGTFLVRAYQHKKMRNFRAGHASILEALWGIDISKFAAHLSTINLAIKDLREDENYPRIIHSDFFKVSPERIGFKVPKSIVKGLGAKEKEFIQPRMFDAIVGNPPYTRQEEMEDMTSEGYKTDLIAQALTYGGLKIADISKRAGIHAYFFVHGTKFLGEGGRFGFIVSNSWLDVDYGKGLQEFFLKNYMISAIIESKVERWFVDADINTCIVLMERCSSAKEREANHVKFVQLKKKLSEFIPVSTGDFESERKRLEAVEDLIKEILPHREYYENADMRIYPKLQSELWKEGFDREEKQYVGSKWGKYVRAPEIFFRILEKGKNVFVPLKEVADVRFGIKTGANEFFYLTEDEIKTRAIEKGFWIHKENGKLVPNYVIKSPKECKSIIVKPEDLKYRVLMIHKDKKDLKGTNVLKYIEWGEREGYHRRPTCASRKNWYDLGERKPFGFLHPMIHNDRQIIVDNVHNYYVDHNLFEIKPKRKEWLASQAGYFISTPAILIKELGGRVNLGEGALKTEGVDIERLLAIDVTRIKKESAKKIPNWIKNNSAFVHDSVFSELGAQTPEEVSLDKVRLDRRELDKIIMGEVLGLSEKEQLEVYRAVIDLVKSRIDKARSVPRKKKSRAPDEKVLVQGVLRFVDVYLLKKFPDDYIGRLETDKIEVPEGTPEAGNDLKGFFVKILGTRIPCQSRTFAEYIKYAVLSGNTKIKVPKDESAARKAVEEYRKIYHDVENEVDQYLVKFVSDRKLREKIKRIVWNIATERK